MPNGRDMSTLGFSALMSTMANRGPQTLAVIRLVQAQVARTLAQTKKK